MQYRFSDILKLPMGKGVDRRRKQTQTTYDDRHLRARNGFLWVIVALAVVAVVAFVGAALAHNYFYPAGMPYYYGYPGFGWWFFPFGFFFFLIFLFFIFRVVFWGFGGWGWRRRYWYGYGDPHEILRQRYARGEITKEQFEQMTRDLEQHH